MFLVLFEFLYIPIYNQNITDLVMRSIDCFYPTVVSSAYLFIKMINLKNSYNPSHKKIKNPYYIWIHCSTHIQLKHLVHLNCSRNRYF
jgi:hypothetical protein